MNLNDIKDVDCIIVAVAHKEFRELGLDNINSLFKNIPNNQKVLIDVKGIYDINDLRKSGMNWWRL